MGKHDKFAIIMIALSAMLLIASLVSLAVKNANPAESGADNAIVPSQTGAPADDGQTAKTIEKMIANGTTNYVGKSPSFNKNQSVQTTEGTITCFNNNGCPPPARRDACMNNSSCFFMVINGCKNPGTVNSVCVGESQLVKCVPCEGSCSKGKCVNSTA
jgi:hypothetical protein